MGTKKKIPDHSAIPARPVSSFINREDTWSEKWGFQRHYTTKEEANKLIAEFSLFKGYPVQERLDEAYEDEDLVWKLECDSMPSVRKVC
jgi:hypothetical protein